MKTKITGDREPWHILAAHKAIDAHKERNYIINKTILHTIMYKGRKIVVEVVTRKSTVSATVIAGHRELWANSIYLH